jgi:threonine dehydrogenase-like Zn-dependent dehydrogenase
MVAVRACGLCGSDLSYINSGVVGLTPVASAGPLPLGHEAAGEVIHVGSDVHAVVVGDRVVINPIDWSTLIAIGNGSLEGAFTENVLVSGANAPGRLLKIRGNVPYEFAALAEPLAVALHAVRRSGATAGSKVAVFGAGPIGLAIVLWLKEIGVDAVAVADLSPARLERATLAGAASINNSRERSASDWLTTCHGQTPDGAPDTDVYIDAAAAPGLISEIISIAKYKANITVVGLYHHPQLIDFGAMLQKEMSITTTMGYPDELSEVLDFITENHSRLELYISGKNTLD